MLDIDGLDAEAELRILEKEFGSLPPSVELITARGRHVWFRYPTDVQVPNSAGKIAPGCDIRATADTYWRRRRYIQAAGVMNGQSIVRARTGTGLAPRKSIAAEQRRDAAAPAGAMARAGRSGAAEGTRDCTVTKLAGHLLRRRIDPFVALELLQSWNATRCVPPLPAKDIERIVASVAGRELRRRTDA